MRLRDIETNTPISISTSVNGKVLHFNTKAVTAIGDNLLVLPITQNGKTIGFANYPIQILYTYKTDKPYVWQNAKVQLVKYKGTTFHQIVAPGPAAILNRRDGVRQVVNVKGIATGRDFQQEVLIRDISANGISFVADRSLPVKGNVRINFRDMDYDFSLAVSVCWSSNPENTNRFIYGCQIVSKNIRVEAYIHAKQRQEGQLKK